jgi:hypothetical protein
MNSFKFLGIAKHIDCSSKLESVIVSALTSAYIGGLSADKVKKLGKDRGRVMETLLSNASTIMWILVMLAVVMYLVIVFIFGEED